MDKKLNLAQKKKSAGGFQNRFADLEETSEKKMISPNKYARKHFVKFEDPAKKKWNFIKSILSES